MMKMKRQPGRRRAALFLAVAGEWEHTIVDHLLYGIMALEFAG
jgi:hypothetical protein